MISQGIESVAGLAKRLFGKHQHLAHVEAVQPIWEAWRAGDFAAVKERAADGLRQGRAVDEARHLLTLAAAVTGDHRTAIDTYRGISPSYRGLAELDEPVLWSYVHMGDAVGAGVFARSRRLNRAAATAARLRLAAERPLQVEIGGTVEVPFTSDGLTPWMPGFGTAVNGRPMVARLDTGGSFLHVSVEQAARLGIATVASERSFAALSWHRIGYGIADLEVGPVRIRNAPVWVHERGLPSQAIASAFGVELGPIIGTNVLRRFLATIDGPAGRLLLSPRNDAGARQQHLSRLPATAGEVPFALWADHCMLAKANPGKGLPATFFIDSGLAMVNSEQGQAAMLVPARTLHAWKMPAPPSDRFADCPGPLALGPISRDGMKAFVVPDVTWADFGDWGGIRVDGLISWGFLKHVSWTLDFDRRRFLFGGQTRDRPSASLPSRPLQPLARANPTRSPAQARRRGEMGAGSATKPGPILVGLPSLRTARLLNG